MSIKLTNQWIEMGLRKGLREGRREGRQEMVLQVLQLRVGAVAKDVHRRIDRLSDAGMDTLGEALLDFAGPADLDTWLDPHEPRPAPPVRERTAKRR